MLPSYHFRYRHYHVLCMHAHYMLELANAMTQLQSNIGASKICTAKVIVSLGSSYHGN